MPLHAAVRLASAIKSAVEAGIWEASLNSEITMLKYLRIYAINYARQHDAIHSSSSTALSTSRPDQSTGYRASMCSSSMWGSSTRRCCGGGEINVCDDSIHTYSPTRPRS